MTDSMIWENVLDNAWDIYVFRTGEYTGRLEIRAKDQPEVKFSKEIHLAYGAKFGPDIDDVESWCEIAMNYVDGLNVAQS